MTTTTTTALHYSPHHTSQGLYTAQPDRCVAWCWRVLTGLVSVVDVVSHYIHAHNTQVLLAVPLPVSRAEVSPWTVRDADGESAPISVYRARHRHATG